MTGLLDPRAWTRLRAHPGARLGLALVCFVALVALVGPALSPHDPSAILPEGLSDRGVPAGPGALLLGADTPGADPLPRDRPGPVAHLGDVLALCLGRLERTQLRKARRARTYDRDSFLHIFLRMLAFLHALGAVFFGQPSDKVAPVSNLLPAVKQLRPAAALPAGADSQPLLEF